MNPMIDWKDQYEHIKKKMQMTARKLTRIDMKVHQTFMCFNMHMPTNVFFGRGIENFNDK